MAKGNHSLGLALGVGVAYGFCHIGVLRVMEEGNIPIDAISGASMGAVIASLWATGRNSYEIANITKEFHQPQNILELIDVTLPVTGFIRGEKLHDFLKRYLGAKTFKDTRIPLKIVASDIRKRKMVVFEKGKLVDSLMYSCAMPGIFSPAKSKGQVLLDGGIISPLPIKPLLDMRMDKVIAVNVTSVKPDPFREKKSILDFFENKKSRNDFLNKSGINQYLRKSLKTNILEILLNSFEILQAEVALNQESLADLVLHPDVSGLHWVQLYKAGEFIKRGEAAARKNLDKIKKLAGI